jgi:hypothetical protein
VDVACHESVEGSYIPPELPRAVGVQASLLNRHPPQTIISVPVHTAVCSSRADGAPVSVVAAQVSEAGSYRPPLLIWQECSSSRPQPPHTIISVPVHTAVCCLRGNGAFVPLVVRHVSVAGSYRDPELYFDSPASVPPQMIISAPVHTDEVAMFASGSANVGSQVPGSASGTAPIAGRW